MPAFTSAIRGLILAAMLAMPLGACLEFSQGVVERPMANDPRLLGYWENEAHKDPAGILVETGGPATQILTLREPGKCASDRFVMTRTEIDGRGFIEVGPDPEGPDRNEKANPMPIAYEMIDDAHIRLLIPDEAVFMSAVIGGEIAGTVTKGYVQDGLAITASGADLRSFLARHPEAMDSAQAAVLTRKAPPRDCP